jgi:hypothetical protein
MKWYVRLFFVHDRLEKFNFKNLTKFEIHTLNLWPHTPPQTLALQLNIFDYQVTNN